MMDKPYEPSDEEYAEPGNTIWHASEPDGGPDVGITVGLGNGRHLWCGEITKDRWESIGGWGAGLGDDHGFWLILDGQYARGIEEAAQHFDQKAENADNSAWAERERNDDGINREVMILDASAQAFREYAEELRALAKEPKP